MRLKRNHGELGQGLVEFAVIFPLFVFFLFAIVDVGLAMSRRSTMQHAVREGARFAATRDNSDGGQLVRERTADQSQDLVDESVVEVCYDPLFNDGVQGPGDAVDVTAPYSYEPFILNTALGFFGAGEVEFDLGVTGSARLERSLVSGGTPC